MKKYFFLFAFALAGILHANAKIWRVSNVTGILGDFTNLSAAVNSASVLAGDTIHLEASASDYGGASISKKLVIIGPGYYLTETAPMVANPKTQVNTKTANVYGIYFLPGSKGSVVSGVVFNSFIVLEDSLITIQRSATNDIYMGDNSTTYNTYSDTIRQNAIYGRLLCGSSSTGKHKNLLVYNNLFFYAAPVDFSNNINNVDGFVINNDFLYQYSIYNGNSINITSANIVYQNNIFGYVNFGAYQSANVYFNNICMGTGLPSGNNNVQNADVANVVYKDWTGNGAGYSSDSRYQLKTGTNPAVNAGLLNGGTVDCGAFGGPAPYILSGMPNIPSIYLLTVPTQINSGTNSMNVTISSASH